MFAPVALVAFGIAILIVLASAGGSDDSSSKEDNATRAEQRDLRLRKQRRARVRERRQASRTVYVVRAGDTLGGIAEKTGVSVEKLQELNPDVDPQALTSGQRLKLK